MIRRIAAVNATQLVICGPLEFMIEEVNSTIGVVAASKPSTDQPLPSHSSASARSRKANEVIADTTRASQMAVDAS